MACMHACIACNAINAMSLRYSCRERHPQSGTIACPAASMLLLVPLGGLVLLQLRTSFCAHGINSCLARLQHILITTAAQPEALSSAFVSMSSLLPPHVENGFRLALVTAISRPSVCVPEGAFLFTYANKFHQDLMRMQMFPVQDESCIVSRYVALCFGGNWHPACVEAPALPAMGHHGALFYHHVLWVKWRLSRLALATQGCRMVLFLEADVVLLRNPFVAVVEHFGSLDHIDLLYSASARSLRALHARLEAESEKCVKAQSNTGILLVRNLSLVDAVIEEEPWVKIPGTPLDQELVDDVLGRPSSNKWYTCMLPDSFTNYCFSQKYGSVGVNWCAVTAFHATCCEHQKLSTLNAAFLHMHHHAARCYQNKAGTGRQASKRQATDNSTRTTKPTKLPRKELSRIRSQERSQLQSTNQLARRLNMTHSLHLRALSSCEGWCSICPSNGADRRRGPAGYCQLKPLSGNDFRMTSWVAPGLTQHGSAAAGVAPLAR